MEGRKKGRDAEKEQHWRRMIGDAARSKMCIRRFYREPRLRKSRFYLWQRRLNERQEGRAFRGGSAGQAARDCGQATFALVREDGGDLGASGIKLVPRDGRRPRIGRRLDEETLRTVVGVLEEGC